MDQVTEQEPQENNEQPLADTEKCRLCRWLLEIAFADDHYATPHFVRSFIARLDQRIRKADYNRAASRNNAKDAEPSAVSDTP
jgi:hypothetical protein